MRGPPLQCYIRSFSSPMEMYNSEVASGKLQFNAHQVALMDHLDGMYYNLLTGKPCESIYIYGGPGCGKTYLMDMFYHSLPSPSDQDPSFPKIKKSRVHFNDFMINVHKRLFQLKKSSGGREIDLLNELSQSIKNESDIICFDEFQVTDIADAMILKNLFDLLLEKGVKFVFTSNRPPLDLYKNGIQRDLFMHFIYKLQEVAHVHSMDAMKDVDFRKLKYIKEEEDVPQEIRSDVNTDRVQSEPNNSRSNLQKDVTKLNSDLYLYPLSTFNKKQFDTLFLQQSSFTKISENINLSIYGHNVKVPYAINGRRIAKFSFKSLCEEMLGAADYVDIPLYFHTIFLYNVPVLDLTNRNELRRFITLIDALYENKVLLYILAEEEPFNLLNISDAERQVTQQDEVFAFDRTISRLMEMQSNDYFDEVQKININSNKQSPFLYYSPKSKIFKSQKEFQKIRDVLHTFRTVKEIENKLQVLTVLQIPLEQQEQGKDCIAYLYREYNWGRDVDTCIPHDNVLVLCDDLVTHLNLNLHDLQESKTRKKEYTFEEFVHMIKGNVI